jgi:hypothetical protein
MEFVVMAFILMEFVVVAFALMAFVVTHLFTWH